MRAVRRTRDVSSDLDGSLESLLTQFSATTLELNPSLGTSEFARRLTARTAQMLGARAAVLAVVRDSEWSIAGLSGPAHSWDAKIQQRLAAALAEQATVPASDLRSGPAAVLFGRELADALGWREVVLAPLTGSESGLLGVLCLVELRGLSETDGNYSMRWWGMRRWRWRMCGYSRESNNRESNGWRISTPSRI